MSLSKKIGIVLVAAAVAVGAWYYNANYAYTKLTTIHKAQDAVFYVALGYAGGLNDTPLVLPRDNSTVMHLNDKEIYLDTATAQDVLAVADASSPCSRPKIRVFANVALATTTGWRSSIPGEDARYPEEYYMVKINKLYGVKNLKMCNLYGI